VEKIIFFLKNPGNHEKTDEFTMNLRGYPTISINPYLNEKRLFVSACSAVNEDLAKVVIPDSDCYSLIGPINKIGFHDAAITWASFYHLMFKENPNSMKRKNIKPTLQNIVDTFEESLNYFSASETSPYYKKLLIQRNPRQPKNI
jgi:hypothetical protein